MKITGLNHAVLYVRDANRHATFYRDVLGFVAVTVDPAGRYAFMRAGASPNHHDIAFFTIGEGARTSEAGTAEVGLYHLAWEVPTLEDLREMERRLSRVGALVGASDHGVNKSLYAKDPDGLEFEVMWLSPVESWGDAATRAVIEPLDIEAEIERFGARTLGANQ